MSKIELRYGATFGKGDSSDWIDWEVTLNEKEEAAYLRAKMLHLPLDSVPELDHILSDAYKDIEEQEIDNFIDCDDEYVLECTGRQLVDTDEINELVAQRDPHTLEFFGLTEMTDEELDEWDAFLDVDDLPEVCEFYEDFEPSSPFDGGWSLNVEFSEFPDEEYFHEDEARETLTILFKEANGDFSTIDDYVKRCEHLFSSEGTLKEIAETVAVEMGIAEYLKR